MSLTLSSTAIRAAAILGGVVSGAAIALAVGFWLRGGKIESLSRDLQAAENNLSQARTINKSQTSVIASILAINTRHNQVMAGNAASERRSAERNAYLDKQLREALRNAEKPADTRYPRHVSDHLCLRWLANEGRLPHDYPIPDPGQSLAGRDDSIARYCADWNGFTADGGVTFAGKLIDQVGRFKARARDARKAQAAAQANQVVQ